MGPEVTRESVGSYRYFGEMALELLTSTVPPSPALDFDNEGDNL